MQAILKEAKCDMNDVYILVYAFLFMIRVKTTVLMADMADYAVINEIYAKYFTKTFPARAAFAVKTLPKNGLVEIEAVAVVPKSK